MPKQVINNSESGAVVRDKLNDNFTELYDAAFGTPENLPTADEKAGISGLSAADPAVPRSGIIYQATDYTALRAITGQTAGKQASVAYRTTAGDGGGGAFRWDASNLSSQVTADTLAGIYVAPDSDATGASGAWVRQYDGTANVRWWGAVPDGVTDSTAAIQAALDSAIIRVFFPTPPWDGPTAPNYMVSGLTITGNTKELIGGTSGTNYAAIKLIDGSNTDVLTVNNASGVSWIKIENLQIDGNKTNNTSGSGIYFTNNTTLSTEIVNAFIRYCAEDGIEAPLSSDLSIRNSFLTNNARYGVNSGYGIVLKDSILEKNGVAEMHVLGDYYSSGSVLVDNVRIERNTLDPATKMFLFDTATTRSDKYVAYLQNITLRNVYAHNSDIGGGTVYPVAVEINYDRTNLVLENCVFRGVSSTVVSNTLDSTLNLYAPVVSHGTYTRNTAAIGFWQMGKNTTDNTAAKNITSPAFKINNNLLTYYYDDTLPLVKGVYQNGDVLLNGSTTFPELKELRCVSAIQGLTIGVQNTGNNVIEINSTAGILPGDSIGVAVGPSVSNPTTYITWRTVTSVDSGTQLTLSGVTGDVAYVGNPVFHSRWNASFLENISSDYGDNNKTLRAGVEPVSALFASSIGTNRVITLSTSYVALRGAKFKVIRTGLGAGTLDVGGLKTIPAATAATVTVVHNGTAWVLVGYELL